MDEKEIFCLRYKDDIEKAYASILAPYATKRPRPQSRKKEEPVRENENRSDFQRDRDRIIHSQAFRRMMYKTQVFVNHEGDHFRTRLTHSLEVAQLARGISKSLALNEDLAEAIALGHDLGHTPFGHVAEKVFSQKLRDVGLGKFYHNEQSVRVVDVLESRGVESSEGLNLTFEVREGILKHNKDRTGQFEELNPNEPCSSIEGQIVQFVDTIAYTCHDLDDGIKAGILEDNCNNNPEVMNLFKNIYDEIKTTAKIEVAYKKNAANRFIADLIHFFVERITLNTFSNLKEYNIISLDRVKELSQKGQMLVDFDEQTKELFIKLKKFVEEGVYRTSTVQIMDAKAERVINDLFDTFSSNISLIPPSWLYKSFNKEKNGLNERQFKTRIVIDYIACMTDRYALEEHERLFNPRIKI